MANGACDGDDASDGDGDCDDTCACDEMLAMACDDACDGDGMATMLAMAMVMSCDDAWNKMLAMARQWHAMRCLQRCLRRR
mmetsp:Transcript_4157/g.4770  ORF Transcript_4157/g.4770 Transcript_4157/m.4770 type:complete len:81 (-) Transcript_4157:57-299(-)